ncbi:MAG TPA: BamA/TamA family outer membrane protein [Chitinophagaceae bacterium]|nr:BamA/TamA family outer membrane protein [Chitinophagaceae bacterium]
MRKHFSNIIFLAGIVSMLSCNITKRVPEGDALYTGASVKVDGPELTKKKKKTLRGELSSLVRPKPNKKILGVPFKLAMYNMGGFFKKKFGEPPVLLSEVNLETNEKVLQSTLENTGYFKATVKGDTIVRGKKARAVYDVKTGSQYKINEITFTRDSSILSRNIDTAAQYTFLKKDRPFDLALVKAERERIEDYLKERGFYYFSPDHIIVQVDSTIGGNKINMFVKVKPATPDSARQVYHIRDVYIFPNYRLGSATSDTLKKNASFYKGFYVVDRKKLYKPEMFALSMRFDPGDVYSRTDQNQSINRLVNLGVFKFVKNRFEEVGKGDSAQLDAFYYLTPLPKKSLRAEVNGSTKSNNLTGSSVTVGWRNRNTFKGGELLSIDATGGFEVQFSGVLRGYNTYRGGLETNLAFPRFLVPFVNINTKSGYVPRTTILLAYDLLNKSKLYTMNSFRAGFGYNWKETIRKEHQLFPIAITYVQPLKITPLYEDSARGNPTLQKAVEKQFILGSTYNFNYNQLQGDKKTGLYFNGNLDLSGNVAGLVSGANINKGKPRTLFDAQFSQYVRVEGDVRHYTGLSKNSVWANRIIVGLGYPYGNSGSLPFIKQFFVGGTNSIRAFRSRSLGPGTYKDTAVTGFLPDESGDIKLEANTEWRMKLFSIVQGAIFIDAGNIWLYNKDSVREGVQFSKNFMKEFAVGGGVGLRFDISFLVLRLDLAIPFRKPWLPDGERWVIDKIDFRSGVWRRENLVFNLGIGYPF